MPRRRAPALEAQVKTLLAQMPDVQAGHVPGTEEE